MFATHSNTNMSQGVTTPDIIEKLNKTILSNVANVVDPFVELINTSKKRDSLIAEVLRSLPEYKSLLAENNHLREITGNTGVKIQIKEKLTPSDSVNSIDSLREEYDIPQSDNIVSDVKTVKTNLTSVVSKDTKIDHHLQSKLKSWSVKFEEFASLVDVDNTVYDDFNDLKNEFDVLFGNTTIETNETTITVGDSEWGSILGNKMNKTLAKLEAVAAVDPSVGKAKHNETPQSESVTEGSLDGGESEEEDDDDEDDPAHTYVDGTSHTVEEMEQPASYGREYMNEDEDDEDEDEDDEEDEEDEEDIVSEEEEDDGTVDDDEEEVEEVEEEESGEELEVIEMEDEDGNPLEYLTNDPDNGDIYELLDGDEVGKKIGKFVDGEPEFFD